MLEKKSLILRQASVIDRDILLFGPKKASFIKHDISDDLVFASTPQDVVAELGDRPDEWVILRARAIDAGGSIKTGETYYGPNDNGDYFSEEDLLEKNADGKHAFETFIGCCFFTNHQNNDVEKARGKIVNAFYDKKNHCVYTDALIDAKAYPQLARGIRNGYISDVSMGSSIKYSICSICGNKASTEAEFCTHIRNQKGKTVQGQKVYEINKGIKFIELSAVTDGACENCTIQNVYTGSELLCKLKDVVSKSNAKINDLKEVAAFNFNGLLKTASKGTGNSVLVDTFSVLTNNFNSQIALAQLQNNIRTASSEDLIKESNISLSDLLEEKKYLRDVIKDYTINSVKSLVSARKIQSLVKTARGEDIDKLNKALDLLKEVAEQILASKDVDFEFLEDIGGLLSELQVLIVALVEAGFANQTSGQQPEGMEQSPNPAEPSISNDPANPEPSPVIPPTGVTPPAPNPMASNNTKIEKYADKIKGVNNIISEVNLLINGLLGVDQMGLSKKDKIRKTASQLISEKFAQSLDERLNENSAIVVTDGPYSVSIDMEKGIDGYFNNKKVASLAIEDLDEELSEIVKINPHVVAGRLIQTLSLSQTGEPITAQGDYNMENNITKEALLTNKPPVEKVTEKQLEEMNGNFSRKNNPVETEGQIAVTTEKQLDDVPKSEETGKGDFNRVRPEGISENLATTESQLETNSRPTAFGVARDASEDDRPIAERQLSEARPDYTFTRWNNDQAGIDLPITEKQFDGKDRIGTAVDEVSEGQLEGHRQGSAAEKTIEAFVNAMAKVAMSGKISPISIASVKPSASVIKAGKANEIVKSAQVTENSVKTLVENAIIDEIGVNIDVAEEYVDATIDALYEDTDMLVDEIKASANKQIEILKEAMIQGNSTVEAKTVSAVKAAWLKRKAEITDEPVQSIVVQKKTGLMTEDQVKEHFKSEGKTITSIKPAGDAGWAVSYLETPAEMPSSTIQMTQPNPVSASVVEKLQKLAEENKMNKKAQTDAGTTMPPAAPPAADPNAGMPGGLENMGGQPAPEDIGGDIMSDEDEGGAGEAKPFGTICPACGSENVDAMDGECKCNDCSTEFDVEVRLNIKNPSAENGIRGSEEAPEEESTEGSEINDELSAAPAAAPPVAPQAAPMGMPGMAHSNGWVKSAPLRYTAKIHASNFVNKGRQILASKGKKAPIGMFCTQCGGVKVAFKESEGVCVDCGCKHHVEAKHNGEFVNVAMTIMPNLALAEKENKFQDGTGAGYAVTAECENCNDIKKALHEILSNRKSLVKMASATFESNPMLACMSDQIANGYSDESSMQICASIKSLVMKKTALLDDGFGEKDEKDTEDIEDIEDDVEDIEEDAQDIEKKDEDEDFEGIEEVEDEDNVEFEDEELEGEEDATEFVEEESTTDLGIAPENINKITIQGTDADGKDFELEINVGGEIEEETESDEELLLEDDLGEPVKDEDGLEVEEEVELEGSPDEIMSTLFSDGIPKEEDFEECEDEECDEDGEDKPCGGSSMTTNASLLRGDHVMSSNRAGGLNLDINKLARSIGASMPLDTEADVPRNAEAGIVEDGEPVKTSAYENSAKKMKGTAAGSSLQKDEVIQGSDRGVSVIKPKTASGKTLIKMSMDEKDLDGIFGDESRSDSFQDTETPEMNTQDEIQMIIDQLFDGEINKSEAVQRLDSLLGGAGRGEKALQQVAAAKKRIKKAQTSKPNPSEPVDAIQEDKESLTGDGALDNKLDIPRNPAKAKPESDGREDVNYPKEVRTKEYTFGPGATDLHTNVVPRDKGGDGLGGKKPVFDEESWTNQTSGNPDTYVQKIQTENIIKPTPAGNEDNHAVAAKINFALQKVASSKGLKKANLEGVVSPDGAVIVQDLQNSKFYTVSFKKK